MGRPKMDLTIVLDQFMRQFYQSFYIDHVDMPRWTALMKVLLHAIFSITFVKIQVDERHWSDRKRAWDKEWNVELGIPSPSPEGLRKLNDLHIWFTGGAGNAAPIYKPFQLDSLTLTFLPPGLCTASDTVMLQGYQASNKKVSDGALAGGPSLAATGVGNLHRPTDPLSDPYHPNYAPTEAYATNLSNSVNFVSPNPPNVLTTANSRVPDIYPAQNYHSHKLPRLWSQDQTQSSSQYTVPYQTTADVSNPDMLSANVGQSDADHNLAQCVYRIPRKRTRYEDQSWSDVEAGWYAPYRPMQPTPDSRPATTALAIYNAENDPSTHGTHFQGL